jgi:hypothetical protein
MLGIAMPVAMREVAATAAVVSMALVPVLGPLLALATWRDALRRRATAWRRGRRRCFRRRSRPPRRVGRSITSAETTTPAAAAPAPAAVLALRTALGRGRIRARR